MKKVLKKLIPAVCLTLLLHSCSDTTTAPAGETAPKLLSLTFPQGGELYTMNADGSERKKLAAVLTDITGFPAISPDRKKLAFTAGSGSDGLFVATTTSSTITPISERSVRAFVWSRDSKFLAYSESESGSYAARNLYIISADGTGRKLLKENQFNLEPLSFSADGASILFIDQKGVHSIGVNGVGEKPVFSKDSADIREYLGVSSKNEVAFLYTPMYGVQDPDRGFYIMDTEGQNVKYMADIHYWPMDWSPDGNTLLLYDGGAKAEFYSINRDGTGLKKLTETNEFEEVGPKFSPDGKQIGFSTSPTNSTGVVSIMNADGSNRRNISPAGVSEIFLGWVK